EDLYAVTVTELDGRPVVVSGGLDMSVRWWDLQTGHQLGTIDVDACVHALAIGPRQTVLAGQSTGVTAIRLRGDVAIPDKELPGAPAEHKDAGAMASAEQLAERGEMFYRLGDYHPALYEEAVADL